MPAAALIALAGPVGSVLCESRRQATGVDLDEVASAPPRFQGGATGSLASHHAMAGIWRVQACGSRGRIEMRGDCDRTVAGLGGSPESVTLARADKARAELEAGEVEMRRIVAPKLRRPLFVGRAGSGGAFRHEEGITRPVRSLVRQQVIDLGDPADETGSR